MDDKTPDETPVEGAPDNKQSPPSEEYKKRAEQLRRDACIFGGLISMLVAAATVVIIYTRPIIETVEQRITPMDQEGTKVQEKTETGKSRLESELELLDELQKGEQEKLNKLEIEREKLEKSTPLYNGLVRNKELAFVVGDNGLIQVSTDQGMTWKTRVTNTKHDFNAVALSGDGSVAIAVGDNGMIQVSTDKGMTWEARAVNTRRDFNAVALSSDGSVVIAVGDDGMIQVSTDQGMTWGARTTNTKRDFNAVVLSGDGSVGIAVGDDGMLYASFNQGRNWEPYGPETRNDFNAVALSDDGKVSIAVGDNGMIYAFFNQGKEWKSYGVETRDDFNAVALNGDGSIAIAVGDNGLIHVYTDQDKQWSPYNRDTNDDFHAVALSNDDTLAIAVGDDGMIFASTDSGKGSWMRLDDVTAIDLEMVVIGDGGVDAMAAGRNRRNSSIILKIEKQNEQQFSVEQIAYDEKNILKEEAIDLEISEIEERIHFQEEKIMRLNESRQTLLENRLLLENDALLKSEPLVKRRREWLEINFVRGSILLAVIFLSQHLFGLIRYNLRLASFYDSCRDAFRLSGEKTPLDDASISRLEKILRMLSPKDFDFGRSPPSTMVSQFLKP